MRANRSGARPPRRVGAEPALPDDADVDRARLGPVELAEEDRLVAAERRRAVPQRNQHLGPGDRRTPVRGAVGTVDVVVREAPVVADDPLEGTLEIGDQYRIDLL